METGSKVASDEEVIEEAESAWEEEMVKRNLLLANKVNVGLPSEEKMAMERFQDKVASVAELEKRRVPSPRTFFSKTGHWSDLELVGAVQQGLWEVSSFYKESLNLFETRRGTASLCNQLTCPERDGRLSWGRARAVV